MAKIKVTKPVVEIDATGVRKVIETDLTDIELASLREAAEAVRAKQADVASM